MPKESNIDNLLISMISKAKYKDCSFILDTLEYNYIKQMFLNIFNYLFNKT